MASGWPRPAGRSGTPESRPQRAALRSGERVTEPAGPGTPRGQDPPASPVGVRESSGLAPGVLGQGYRLKQTSVCVLAQRDETYAERASAVVLLSTLISVVTVSVLPVVLRPA